MGGIYVHVPFCRRRCIYCDFYSAGARLADWESYVSAILAEARVRMPDADFRKPTMYIGGGTPSLLPPEEFRRLATGLTAMAGDYGEFTVEVNPDDVTEELADVWKSCGTDRISMGVQTLSDEELRLIGRRHDAAQAEKAYRTLMKKFDNISLDLIFGLPGQSMESLTRTLARITELSPKHISAYSLMYEERTALTRLRDNGRISEQDEGDVTEMFRHLSHMLEEGGYEQYEISNYAQPGFRSRHNSSYWQGEPYIGLGPAAHSYDGWRERRANIADIKRYTEYWLDGKGETPWETEILDDNELREEMIMTRLRTREGIDTGQYRQRFGEEEYERLMRRARTWIKSGHMAVSPSGRLALERPGIMISDEIMASFF